MCTGISTFRAPQLAAPLSCSSRAGKSFSFTDAFLCEHERVQKILTFVSSPIPHTNCRVKKDLQSHSDQNLDTVNLTVYFNKQEAMKALKIIIKTQGHMETPFPTTVLRCITQQNTFPPSLPPSFDIPSLEA